MSSTNKTEHLQLNQWVGTDPFRMADFNEDNQKLDAAISELQTGAVRIATGTYRGSGSSGSSHPNTLTFPFQPKLVCIHASTGSFRALFLNGTTAGAASWTSTTPNYTLPCTWSGNTLTWYESKGDNGKQLNSDSTDYVWLAIA